MLSDQFFIFGRIMPDARSLPLPEFLMPDKKVAQQITDCATLDSTKANYLFIETGLGGGAKILRAYLKRSRKNVLSILTVTQIPSFSA